MDPTNFFIFNYNPKAGIIIGIALTLLIVKSI